MELLFIDRQEEDPSCKYVGMYYSLSYERKDLCDIEAALKKGERVTISPASKYDINTVKEIYLGPVTTETA